MHPQVGEFLDQVRKQWPNSFHGKRVLDVGSFDINGTARPWFTECQYTGIDWREGPGVDVVVLAHEHQGEYDTIVCTEMLEHDRYYRQTMDRCREMLAPGGIWIVTCAGPPRREHHPEAGVDGWYRNLEIDDVPRGYRWLQIDTVAGDLRWVWEKQRGAA